MTLRLGDPALESVAGDAAVAINLAVSDLLLPRHVFRLFTKYEETGLITTGYATGARRLAMQILVVNLFRLWEAREQLLCPWLFSDEQLLGWGFQRIEDFVGRWSAFLTVRHQFAGHIRSREAEGGRPGRILAPEAFGRALRESGLGDPPAFLARVENELIPGVERVRAELFTRWPSAEAYVRRVYPERLARAQEGLPDEG